MATLNGTCPVCQREEQKLTKHHLLPRKEHRRKRLQRQTSREERAGSVLWVCRDCHNQIHRSFEHRELMEEYNSLEAMLTHSGFRAYVDWVRKRKPRGKIRVR